MRVLLVEDDPELASVLETGLEEQGFHVVRESDGRGRAQLAPSSARSTSSFSTSCCPGGSGFDLCRQLRERGVGAPVLMLTARDAVDDRVRGLDAGADDYLTKPFAFRELVARLHALARRRPTPLARSRRVRGPRGRSRAHRVRRAGRDARAHREGIRAARIPRAPSRSRSSIARRSPRTCGTRITIRSRTCSRSSCVASAARSTRLRPQADSDASRRRLPPRRMTRWASQEVSYKRDVPDSW